MSKTVKSKTTIRKNIKAPGGCGGKCSTKHKKTVAPVIVKRSVWQKILGFFRLN